MTRLKAGDVVKLATNPCFVVFLVTASSVQAAHALYYGFATLHWRAQGHSSGVIGALWAMGVLAEIGLFVFSSRVVARFGPVRLLGIAGVAAIARWCMTAFDPPLVALFPIQALHALTFGAAHLAAVHFLARAIPERYAATGQGLYATVGIGIAMGGMLAMVGVLYHALGGQAYFVMAGLCVITVIGAVVLQQIWDGGPIEVGIRSE